MTIDQIEEEALALPSEVRARLADRLVEAEWAAQRRDFRYRNSYE